MNQEWYICLGRLRKSYFRSQQAKKVKKSKKNRTKPRTQIAVRQFETILDTKPYDSYTQYNAPVRIRHGEQRANKQIRN